MQVKHWSSAGLVVTWWCNASCAHCYMGCGPDCGDEITVDRALELWEQLIAASPHGCRVHLTGGEPFGDWPRLIEICRQAKVQRLGPPHAIETNAFWATDADICLDRLRQLDEAGMEMLCISADPYHQQFVPIERCRLLAAAARSLLGGHRVRVRWDDWLATGRDMPAGSAAARYLVPRHDRVNGRAAALLADDLPLKPAAEFADMPCEGPLLRGKAVHVDTQGRVMPGTCAGIILGLAAGRSIAQVWRDLCDDWKSRPVLSRLAGQGPVALMNLAKDIGYVPLAGYACKCHLCWHVRQWLVQSGWQDQAGELGPQPVYRPELNLEPANF